MRPAYLVGVAIIHLMLTGAEAYLGYLSGTGASFSVGVFEAFSLGAGMLAGDGSLLATASSACRDVVGGSVEGRSVVQRLLGPLSWLASGFNATVVDNLRLVFGLLLAVKNFFILGGYPHILGHDSALGSMVALVLRFAVAVLLIAGFWDLVRGVATGLASRVG